MRKKETNDPYITIGWENTPKEQHYKHYDSHYEEYPIFTVFDPKYFKKYYLPQAQLRDDCSLTGKELNLLIENLIKEIKNRRKKFKDFILLQNKNFNNKKQCGLIVLKCKKYPFVVKLFLETPKTFINPYCKGIESIAFFYMSGGTNRHITGFTRIKNLHYIQSILCNNPSFSYIDWQFPRKWFWAPEAVPWIHINGYNLGSEKILQTTFPGTYAIIADYIDTKETVPLEHKKRNMFIMDLCNKLHVAIDPHCTNFIINKINGQEKKISVKIIDTEFFPSLVGLKKSKNFRNYNSWYQYLTGKCIGDMYFRPKSTRKYAQAKKIMSNV